MLQRVKDIIVLTLVSWVYSLAVFLLKRRRVA